MTKSLYLSALLNFNTQFAKGYDYKTEPRTYISRFMSPGYLTTGLGLTWNQRIGNSYLFGHFLAGNFCQ